MSLREMLGFPKQEPANPNDFIQMITRRAERLEPRQQAEAFVSLGGIEKQLLDTDHRVIFGRRGTGKTHVMAYMADAATRRGELAVTIDLRTMGSNSYIYSDESIAVPERATRLLRDFVSAIHDGILDHITGPRGKNVSRIAASVEALGAAVQEIAVRDSIEVKTTESGKREWNASGSAKCHRFTVESGFRGQGQRRSKLIGRGGHGNS